jgi:hypothetical protein
VQEFPHPPQSVFVSTCRSQPSSADGAGGFRQLPYSMRHVDVHRPPEHERDMTLAVEQARPHAPQFVTLVLMLTSQPLLATPSQSAKPVLQVKPQTLAVHLDVALARAGHCVVHEPQWFGSVVVFVHWPLQSTWPVGHDSTQEPPEQTCAAVQVRPHEPQFWGFVAVSTHWPLHSENPELQRIPHCEFAHEAVPFAVPGQTLPQPPQFARSELVFTHAPPHAVNPAAQAKPQLPPTQVAAPFGGALHTLPQPPQLAVSVCVLVQVPLQSVSPLAQDNVHEPAEQT